MRRLILFRHASADRAAPGAADRERPLSERGRADAIRVGAYLARHSLIPKHVMVSPALRTRDTWKLAVAGLAAPVPAQPREPLYDATAAAIIDVIKTTPAGAGTLLIVGHNPGLHEAALLLIASGNQDLRERLREDLPAAGLAVITFAIDNWQGLRPHSGRLERFVTPDVLEAETD